MHKNNDILSQLGYYLNFSIPSNLGSLSKEVFKYKYKKENKRGNKYE